jgi:hypothetical protein
MGERRENTRVQGTGGCELQNEGRDGGAVGRDTVLLLLLILSLGEWMRGLLWTVLAYKWLYMDDAISQPPLLL